MSQTTTERTPSHTADSAQLGHLEGVLYRRGYEVKMMKHGMMLGFGFRVEPHRIANSNIKKTIIKNALLEWLEEPEALFASLQ
jgi:hypothetical protein